MPYGFTDFLGNTDDAIPSIISSQEGLALKTYQSDLFNNWLDSEWIDGENGVNQVTKVMIEDGGFTIDAFQIMSKVYMMLNRVNFSDGSFDAWQDANFAVERLKVANNPVYLGSCIREVAFEEVISNASTDVDGLQPLGQLAGRAQMTQKKKGGSIKDRKSVV